MYILENKVKNKVAGSMYLALRNTGELAWVSNIKLALKFQGLFNILCFFVARHEAHIPRECNLVTYRGEHEQRGN